MKVDFTRLDRAFNPRCVAVVGDKKEGDFSWLRGQQTFKGKLYSVQIAPDAVKAIEAMGIENCTSLLDIPEPVDLVIVAVPRAVAPRILEDCIRKDVAAVHFFTSGYAETASEEGTRLERQLAERARQANMHLIGPNCMGIFSPAVGVRQMPDQYSGVTGPVGLISQSGTHAVVFSLEAHLMGIDIWKSVSFGNGIVLDSPDFLEYFGRDPEIKAIGMYLEGVRDGRRFFRVLREVAARKPVVIWKGGRTEDGFRAISSHTGSLAIRRTIWDAAIKQCGAMSVSSLEELIDTVKALIYLPPVAGNGVGIAGGSGGQSVAIADVCAEAGLKVPVLSPESYQELASFFQVIGASYRNPVDTGAKNRAEIRRILGILERDPQIGSLMFLLNIRLGNSGRRLESQMGSLIDMKQATGKPVMAIIPGSFLPATMQQAREIITRLQGNGIPTFVTLERGARALRNALEYNRLRAGVAASRAGL